MDIIFAGDKIKSSAVTQNEYKLPAVGLELTDEGADIYLQSRLASLLVFQLVFKVPHLVDKSL